MRATPDPAPLLGPIRQLHAEIRHAVVTAAEAALEGAMAEIAEEAEGDTIYAVDKVSEALLVDFIAREIAPKTPVRLVAEGLHGGGRVLPEGTPETAIVWRILVDPIDGTRGLMYQKRSGWVLTAVAPERGHATSLSDVVLAVQTEIPLVKQHLSDALWAFKGQGLHAERFNRVTGESHPITLRASRATSVAHGFAMIARFFPGARDVLAAIDEEILLSVLGPSPAGKAHCFEDQYICTAGQLYELIVGHDRFVADLRPLMKKPLSERGLPHGICCHPYDLATALLAREAGVIVTDAAGGTLDAPLDVDADVAWVGYANAAIRAQIEPALQKALASRGLLPERA